MHMYIDMYDHVQYMQTCNNLLRNESMQMDILTDFYHQKFPHTGVIH